MLLAPQCPVFSINVFFELLGKDTTNRGIAGYWAARDSERAGKTAEACALYDGTAYRYGANWYGYLALGRLTSMKALGNCRSTVPPNDTVARAVANLKVVTVAGETSTEKELDRVEKSDELSIIGLFDWAIDELNTAKKTAGNSPKINLALARHYRWKGDNTAAFLALISSYPDYAQMFAEEMGREECVQWMLSRYEHWPQALIATESSRRTRRPPSSGPQCECPRQLM